MSDKIKRIGVLTSGGDAPGMNAAIRAVVRTAVGQGVECIGIRRGWSGLINSDFVPLNGSSVSHIINKGGTLLYTARSVEFMDESGRDKALNTCRLLGLDGIVAIGGDGTFRGALALSRQAPQRGMNLQVMGIPATIDNDIGCSYYTIGFDSACNTAIECIDKLRDTMQSHERCSVVEVMGRHAGYLALAVGISVGATAVLIPERELDFEQDIVEKIRRARLAGTTHYMVVVAEGCGSAVEIGDRIHEELGIDPRVTVLGHIQRGGSPSVQDRETASRMGYEAVMAMLEGDENCVISIQRGCVKRIEMEEALQMKREFPMERYQLLEALTNGGSKFR
ncbi:ATP-dependent 6-phosphofructokinase [Flintibacter muris]|uniref:ATP-dependent 6-phosphofructokinase n=1 Tax=Flintibacter muris TaxID=2941327 RepID=UPI00203B6244|nr:ATP-dependent 6-phosphofructokinase [Flintibacter muris]